MASSIQKVYIADGFVDDCEELIQRCLQSALLSYSSFCDHWKDMKFAYVFKNRTSGAELAEFTEEAIHIAKRYMVANTSNYEESVAGLFIVYALLNIQPFSGFAPLRVTPPDLDAIYCLKDVARRQKRLDVLYILGKVLIEGPCQFHFGDREYGMDRAVRKYCQVTTSVDRLGARPKGVFYRQNEELDLLRELSGLGRRYTRAKALIYGNKRPDKTLDYMDEHLPNEMAASLKQLIVGGSGNVQKPEEVAMAIKEKAMRDAVGGLRHLTAVHQRALDKGEIAPKSPTKKKRRKICGQSTPDSPTVTSPDKPPKLKTYKPRKPEAAKQKEGAPVNRKLNIKSPKKAPKIKPSDNGNDVFTLPHSANNKNTSTDGKGESSLHIIVKPAENKTPSKVSPKLATLSPTKKSTKAVKTTLLKCKDIRKKTHVDSDSNSDDDFSIASSGSSFSEPEEQPLNSLSTIDEYLAASNQLTLEKLPVYIRSINEQNMEIEIINTKDQQTCVKGKGKSPKVRTEGKSKNIKPPRNDGDNPQKKQKVTVPFT